MPSSAIVTRARRHRSSTIVARDAAEWRTTLVATPARCGTPSPARARRHLAVRDGRRARRRARGRSLRRERRRAAQLRLRLRARSRLALVAPQERSTAHLIQRGLAESPDVRERLARPFGLAVEEVKADPGLHVDLAERVGEHVVQLAGDAAALLLLAGMRRCASGAAGLAVPRRARMPSPMPKQRAAPGSCRRSGRASSPAEGRRDDRRQPRDADRDQRPQAGAPHHGADDPEGEGDEGRAGVRRHEQVGGP